MTSTTQVQQEEYSAEGDVQDALMQCIRVLLQSFNNRSADPEDDQTKDIGEIQIIVDGKGTMAPEIGMMANELQSQNSAVKSGLFIMSVPTVEEARVLEMIFAQYAYKTQLLHNMIQEVNPNFAAPQWQEELHIVSDEIAEVFLKTTFIVPESPMHILLRKAIQAARC